MATLVSLHCKNEWVILTLIWLHEFQFLLRLYKSMLLSCLVFKSSSFILIYIDKLWHDNKSKYNVVTFQIFVEYITLFADISTNSCTYLY